MEDENKTGGNAEAESGSKSDTKAENKSGSNTEAVSKPASNKRLAIICGTIVAVVGIGAAALVLSNRANAPGPEIEPLGYAEGVIALDEDSLQAAVDAMIGDGEFATEYKGTAASTDGKNFTCYIGNSALNKYDMYFQIFADGGLTDQLFLSKLLRPGTALDSISLDHALEPGSHTVYVVYTQVKEDLATIQGQVTITMDFVVAK